MPARFSQPETAAIAIIPVPYDSTSTWMKGADKGPRAMLEASTHLEPYDIETDSEVYRRGIFIDKPVTEASSPADMVEAVRTRIKRHLNAGRFAVVAGGEHSVSIGSVQAHAEKFRDLTVLQLDAHADCRQTLYGSKYNHGCVMARINEVCSSVQVGIRSMHASEKQLVNQKRTFFADEICARPGDGRWMKKAIALLSRNVYITVDLDVFDPSVVPATGTPEPGGMQWYQVLKFLRYVATKRNMVGFDVVELCPMKDSKTSDFLAAKLIYKMLSYKFMLG